MAWYIPLHIRIRVLGGILGVQILLFFAFAFAFAFTNGWLCLLRLAFKDFGYPLQSAR